MKLLRLPIPVKVLGSAIASFLILWSLGVVLEFRGGIDFDHHLAGVSMRFWYMMLEAIGMTVAAIAATHIFY